MGKTDPHADNEQGDKKKPEAGLEKLFIESVLERKDAFVFHLLQILL